PPGRRYTNDEVEGILRRALERQSASGSMTHEELVETAREVGVSPEDLEASIVDEEIEREVRGGRELRRTKARRAFFAHVAGYIVANAFLTAMNPYIGGAIWFPIVLLGWGFAVALQGLRVFFPKDDKEAERAVRERIAAEVRARRAPPEDPLGRSARELGSAV